MDCKDVLRNGLWLLIFLTKGFPGGSVVKNQPALQEVRVGSLGQEDTLEKEMATPSSILAWRIPWTEEPGGYSPWVLKSQTRLSNLARTQFGHLHIIIFP